VANTDKQNVRYPKERWKLGISKAEVMREAGYDVDMTKVVAEAVDRFVDETIEQTAKRLRLKQADEPVRPYRAPYRRTAA
jgi:hypothetical protein